MIDLLPYDKAYQSYLPVEKHEVVSTMLGESISRIYKVEELYDFDRSPLPYFTQAIGFAVASGCSALGIKFPIFFCLVKSTESAFSIRLNDWACIMVSDTIALRMFHVVSGLTCYESFVRYREDQPQAQRVHWSRPAMAWPEILKIVESIVSINRRQQPLTKAVTLAALNFIASHELAHIANGHLLGSVGAVFRENGSLDDGDKLISRTLEYDADALAIQLSLNYFLEMSRGVATGADEEEFFKSDSDAIQTTFVGACMIMHLIEVQQSFPMPSHADGSSHPPASHRLWTMISAAENALALLRRDGRLSLPAEVVHAALTRAVRSIEMAAGEKAGAHPDIWLSAANWQARGKSDLDIFRCWARIRPFLERFKLGNHTLAAAQFDVAGNPLPRSQPELRHMSSHGGL